MRWVNLTVLADETGVPTRTLQHIRRHEPGVLVERLKHGKIEYAQPQTAINLRQRAVDKASAKFLSHEGTEKIEEAERRKKVAEADLAELKLARERREVLAVVDAVREREREYMAFNGALDGVPSREAREWPEVTPGIAIQRLRAMVGRIKESLQRVVEGAIDDEPEPEGEGDDTPQEDAA